MVRSAPLGSQMRLLNSRRPGAAKSRRVPSGSWAMRDVGVAQRAEHVGEHGVGARDIGGKVRWLAECGARRIHRDIHAFGLLGAKLQLAGYEGAIWCGVVALEGVEKATALGGILAWHRRGGGGFAGARDREGIRNVQAECAGVAVGRIVGERKPARGEEQVRAFLADDGGFDAGDGAIVFVCEKACVGERESHLGAGAIRMRVRAR